MKSSNKIPCKYFIIGLLGSIILFFILYFIMGTVKNKLDSKAGKTISTDTHAEENIAKFLSEIITQEKKCLKKNKDLFNECNRYLQPYKQPKKLVNIISKPSKKIIKGSYFLSIIIEICNENILIQSIYFLLIMTLSTQLSLSLYIHFEKKPIQYYYFLVSDWAVNSPPIFGVLGTIISFALLMEQTKTIPIEQAFTEGFFDAAITTVIGGFFYSINLFLTIFIHPSIKKNDLD